MLKAYWHEWDEMRKAIHSYKSPTFFAWVQSFVPATGKRRIAYWFETCS